VSVIDEFPKGRKEIKTILTPELKREDAYVWIKKELSVGHQLFIVCPFIELSESETLQSVKAASEEIKKIETIFKEFSSKLLHGRLKADEKDEIMKDFAEGKLDILVSTPVVEVGIDVPNASVIIIEGAERFGLAQLHQLRGRVGRSDIQSYCLLFSTNSNPTVQKRLSTFCGTLDGYELARYDLKHRGGGNIFGTQQHGYSPIALETLLDGKLTEKVQKACGIFVANNYKVTDYPYLVRRLKAFHFEDIAQN
jgi:ATP-dependent DNA helicase RecG